MAGVSYSLDSSDTLIVYGDPPRDALKSGLTRANQASFESGLKDALGEFFGGRDLSGATTARISDAASLDKALSAGKYNEVIYYGHSKDVYITASDGNIMKTVVMSPNLKSSISPEQWSGIMAAHGIHTTAILGCDSMSFAAAASSSSLRAGGLNSNRMDTIAGDRNGISYFSIQPQKVWWFGGN